MSTQKEFVELKEEMMEDNCKQRTELYKELMKGYIQQTNGNDGAEKTQPKEQDETPGNEARESGNAAHLVCMVESLQQNVTDIKQKAKSVFELLSDLEDPQTTIDCLRKELAEITAELNKTREDVLCRNKELKILENTLSELVKVLQDITEKLTQQNKCIQELTQLVEQKDDKMRRLQDLEATIATVKQEIQDESSKKTSYTQSNQSVEQHGRKRCLERQEEGPPAKQGTSSCSRLQKDS